METLQIGTTAFYVERGMSPAAGWSHYRWRQASSIEQRMLTVLESLDKRLQSVEQWPTCLEVVLDLLDRDLEKRLSERIKAGIV